MAHGAQYCGVIRRVIVRIERCVGDKGYVLYVKGQNGLSDVFSQDPSHPQGTKNICNNYMVELKQYMWKRATSWRLDKVYLFQAECKTIITKSSFSHSHAYTDFLG